jgi:hypothetical protein
MYTATTSPAVDAILDLFCQHLNRWIEADELSGKFRYTPERFTTHDASRDLYGSISLPVIVPLEYHGLDCLTFDISDGEEGGPSTLIALVRHDDPTNVRSITQVFDTMPSTFYNADSTPGPWMNSPTTD